MEERYCELVFACNAESEENEKFRCFYEGIRRIKEGRLPTSTQWIQTGRILVKDSDSQLSVVGAKQLLNMRLKLDRSRFWASVSAFDFLTFGSCTASRETFHGLVGDDLRSRGIEQSCLTLATPSNLERFREWIVESSASRMLVVTSCEFVSKLLQSPIVLRNCDICRVSCSISPSSSHSCSFSNARVLYRSEFSSVYPQDTVLSWSHILHTSADVAVSEGEGESDPDSVCSTPVAVGHSREDLNPVCRICQVTHLEMPSRRLIKPCKCSGSVKYVHRDCLNQWRSTSPFAFSTCSMCGYNYKIRSPLVAKLMLNEDLTFVLALLLMGPVSLLVGTMASSFLTRLALWAEATSHFSSAATNALKAVQSVLLISSTQVHELLPSYVLVSLLGSKVLGLAGFFATSNPVSLVSLLVVFGLSLRFKILAVLCILVGWGTAVRELHLLLMEALRALNQWLGTFIMESS